MKCQTVVAAILLLAVVGVKTFPTNEVQDEDTDSGNRLLPLIQSQGSNESSAMYFIRYLSEFMKVKSFLGNVGGKMMSFTECVSCKFAVAFIQHYLSIGATEDDIAKLAYKVCTFLKIETPRVCDGVSKLFKTELTQVLAKVALDPNEVCGVLFQSCGDPVNPLHQWTVPMTPFPKPPVKPRHAPKPDAPKLRVLHISDVHIDPYYQEGTNAECGEPLCCRATSGSPSTPEAAAGYWGDYRNCDVPLRTLEAMLDHINKTHEIDYVIWTGDIPPHDIWNSTRNEVTYLLHSASKLVYKYLGHVPIFPAIGNHESAPVNSFPIPEITGNESISWLYNEIDKAWKVWLPNSSSTLKLGAFYSVPVYPGFRIISLNMNYCNSLNWWLLINSTDPTGQLAWLVAELQMAEDKGEKVHILGHIPPGEPDCLAVWSSNFYKIINRYENTVTAQFYGHTHSDEFEIFYDDKSTSVPRATGIAYIGPSVTMYDGYNPGYRIYTMDGNYDNSTRFMLDHETYVANLTESNLRRELLFELEYSAREAFNMTSLFPEDWDELTQRFENDEQLFRKFYRYFYKSADAYPVSCDDTCRKRFICRMRRGQSNDPLIC